MRRRRLCSWIAAVASLGALILLSHLATLPLSHSAWAQAGGANGAISFRQTVLSSGGGQVGGGNPMRIMTAVGEPIAGFMLNGQLMIRTGYPSGTPSLPPGERTIIVEGTSDESIVQVTVNGVPARIRGRTFRAEGIRLIEGPNAITVVATDLAGNTTSTAITVHLDTHPPARPTLQAPPPVAAASSMQLTGTKTQDTAVWINGREVVARNDETAWSATVELAEGDNELIITTKDAAGNESTSARSTIALDREPPVITMAPPAKTNLTPLRLHGTVDDHLTQVAINGTAAKQTGRAFELSVDLVEGENSFAVIARSPNGHLTEKTVTVRRGTVPTIAGVQPAGGSKLYVGEASTLRVTATDKEQDPIAYQIVLDGTALGEWQPASETGWTPTMTQLGPHTLEARARDDFGGSASQTARVLVLRKPIEPE